MLVSAPLHVRAMAQHAGASITEVAAPACRNAVATGGGGSRHSLGGSLAEAVATMCVRTAPAGSCGRRPPRVTQDGRPTREVFCRLRHQQPSRFPKGASSPTAHAFTCVSFDNGEPMGLPPVDLSAMSRRAPRRPTQRDAANCQRRRSVAGLWSLGCRSPRRDTSQS